MNLQDNQNIRICECNLVIGISVIYRIVLLNTNWFFGQGDSVFFFFWIFAFQIKGVQLEFPDKFVWIGVSKYISWVSLEVSTKKSLTEMDGGSKLTPKLKSYDIVFFKGKKVHIFSFSTRHFAPIKVVHF